MLKIATVFMAVILFSPLASAERIKIAIGSIEYRAKESSENKRLNSYGKGVESDTRAFVDMLTTALVKTNKFDVIERDRMDEILAEQGMTLSGVFSNVTGVDSLNLSGVDYILTGAITEYGKSSGGMSSSKFSMASESTKMAVDVRVLDVESGSISIADTVSRSSTGLGGVSMKGFKVGGGSDESSELGKVMRMTSIGIVNLIVSSVYPIKAIKVDGDQVFLNYGNGLLSAGDLLDVYKVGEEMIDPDTGESLGGSRKLVGQIEVTDAQAKFSVATIVDGEIEKGMLAMPAKKKAKAKKKRKKLFG